MKKKKIDLKAVKVSSFTTSVRTKEVKGGTFVHCLSNDTNCNTNSTCAPNNCLCASDPTCEVC